MRSLRIGRYFGIGVYLHWTFVLLPLWIGASRLLAGGTTGEAAQDVLFVLVLFGCVTLHEFGHALAARPFGIATRDITLLPIGGVARLESRGVPWTPGQELVIAVAGPAVNLAIALALLPIVAIDAVFDCTRRHWLPTAGVDFVTRLMLANVVLIVFNMIPAFPLDGGRVLRALLGFFVPFAEATTVAARIGQVFAVGLAVFGLIIGNPFLLIIALFVMTAAQGEVVMARRVEERIGREPPGAEASGQMRSTASP